MRTVELQGALSLMDTLVEVEAEARADKVQNHDSEPPQVDITETQCGSFSSTDNVKIPACSNAQIEGLQALLSLLEELCAENVPRPYYTSAVRLLTDVLEDATPPSFRTEVTSYSFLQNTNPAFSVGGIDWSRFSQRKLLYGDVEDEVAYPATIASESTFSLVFSILECALVAFSKVSIVESCPSLRAPVQSSERDGGDGCGFEELHFYAALDSEDNRRSDVIPHGQGCVCPPGSTDDHPCYGRDYLETFPSLVGALLRLIQCAVSRIGKEMCKFPSAGHPSGNNAEMERYWSSYYLENFLFGSGIQLKALVPSTSMNLIHGEGDCVNIDLDRACECVPFHSFVGQALVIFSNILMSEVRKGSPDDVLEEYFRVLESLVALVLAVEARYRAGHIVPGGDLAANESDHDGTSRSSRYPVHNSWCPQADDERLSPSLEKSTQWYIEELVERLRAVVDEISAQKRKMPEFLLKFILKHIASEDCLHTVAEVFLSFSRSHLDIRANFSIPEGLVSDVLQVALTSTSRSSVLSTLVGFITDFIQDVPPIETSGHLSEISRQIDWFVNIAHGLTLAAGLAASEHSAHVENEGDLFMCDVSIMAKGIGRVLAEGTTVVQWLLDLGRSLSETAWRELAVTWNFTETCTNSDKTLEDGGSFANFCKFLSWVDTMRRAVGHVITSRKVIGAEFASWLEKGRIFVDQLLRLLTSENTPGFVKMSFIAFTKQQGHLRVLPGKNEAFAKSLASDPKTRSLNGDDARRSCERDPLTRAETSDFVSDVCQSRSVTVDEQADYDLNEQQRGHPICMEAQIGSCPDVLSTGAVVTTITVETQKITKVTLTRLEKSLIDAEAMDAGNVTVAPEAKRRWQIPTSVILKRLMKKTRPLKRKLNNSSVVHLENRIRSRQGPRGGKPINRYAQMIWDHEEFAEDFLDEDVDIRENGMDEHKSTNSYLDLIRAKDSSRDNVSDLNDFIVSKDGRDYSLWLKKRQNMRRRSYRRNFFKRLRERREFLLLLQG